MQANFSTLDHILQTILWGYGKRYIYWTSSYYIWRQWPKHVSPSFP